MTAASLSHRNGVVFMPEALHMSVRQQQRQLELSREAVYTVAGRVRSSHPSALGPLGGS